MDELHKFLFPHSQTKEIHKHSIQNRFKSQKITYMLYQVHQSQPKFIPNSKEQQHSTSI